MQRHAFVEVAVPRLYLFRSEGVGRSERLTLFLP